MFCRAALNRDVARPSGENSLAADAPCAAGGVRVAPRGDGSAKWGAPSVTSRTPHAVKMSPPAAKASPHAIESSRPAAEQAPRAVKVSPLVTRGAPRVAERSPPAAERTPLGTGAIPFSQKIGLFDKNRLFLPESDVLALPQRRAHIDFVLQAIRAVVHILLRPPF